MTGVNLKKVIGPTGLRVLALLMEDARARRPSTERGIARRIGISVNAVRTKLRALRKRGLVTRENPFPTATTRAACRFVPAALLEPF